MSRKGYCWDNRVDENFFETLKSKLVHIGRYQPRAEPQFSNFDYQEMFYNRKRSHSYLGFLWPEQFKSRIVPASMATCFKKLSVKLGRGQVVQV